MRRLTTLLLACASLALSAQTSEAPRFAMFSMQYLVTSSVKARKVYSELEVTQKQLQDKIQAKQAEGQKLTQQLQSTSISEEGKVQLQKQLRDLEFEFKKLQEDSQAEFQGVQKRVMKSLSDLAGPVVTSLAKEQKLQVIFSAENAPLVWVDETWGNAFTAEVAKRLDGAEAAPAGKPAPAAKPAEKKPAAPAKKP
ncbi:MAG TPA: OmpH family outer membrane protein [Holophagaceae bacterium]|nr:OmpH family outer membrane protein [Holophagaceae bacterium]